MTASKKYKNYETALERLEEITEMLESGELSLEDSIKLYTEGMEISKICDGQLKEAEKKIKIILKKNGKMTEEDFETEDRE